MNRELTLKIEIKQTLIGKAIMKSKAPVILVRLRIMDVEKVKAMLLKTFKFRIGSDKRWRRLNND